MYREYLGEGYHDKVRKLLKAGDKLLPDRIIDAGVNIGAMKRIIAPVVDKRNVFYGGIHTEEDFNKLSEAAVYILCGVLCTALKSCTSAPPYNAPEYKKNWDKKWDKLMKKGNLLIRRLLDNAQNY